MVPATIKGFVSDPGGRFGIGDTERTRPWEAHPQPACARYSAIPLEGFASSMAIPGYDSGDVVELTLERTGARAEVVAGVVPDEFGLERSSRDPTATALADAVEFVGLEELRAVDAFRIELVYDPSALPPGVSPTDVGIAVETDDGWERLESTVDLEATTVSATLGDRPSGSTIVAIYDGTDES